MSRSIKVALCGVFTLIAGLIFADDAPSNSQFQAFDDQISIGYKYSSSTISNPGNTAIQQSLNSNALDLNVEKLFDNKVWFDVDGSFAFSASSGGANLPFLNNTQSIGFPASITGKVGYGFDFPAQGLQLIPYATVGKVLNYNGVTVPNSGFNSSFYYLYGVGGRIEYVPTDNFMLYFDQSAGYLNDQSGGPVNMNAWTLNSALGLKYNLYPALQIGLEGFYNQTNLTNGAAGYDNVSYTSRNVNQSTYGGMFSLGYVYDAPSTKTSSWAEDYANGDFSYFDNIYSLGYGYAQSINSGGSGASNVASTLNYLDVNVSHLFVSGIWMDLDAQLANSIAQSNAHTGAASNYAPTYLAYPGSALLSLGYALPAVRDTLQFIPYLNGGLVMNVNSYTITQQTSLTYQLSHDIYIQYGGGVKAEYIINNQWQVYFNQLFAGLSDQSGLGLGVWRSTSTLGGEYNVYGPLQLGLNLYYDRLSPTGSPSGALSSPVLLNQSTVGGIFSVGLRY